VVLGREGDLDALHARDRDRFPQVLELVAGRERHL
jgi:hypothetical protein